MQLSDIKEDVSYTTRSAKIAILVHKIHFVGEDYIKLRGSLWDKFYNCVYETKNYKLYKEQIRGWYQLKDVK